MKLKSFEFIMIEMINWYLQENYCESIDDFNMKNDFSWKKVLLFPYFVYAANGNREKLLNLFSTFIPDEIGILEQDISEESVTKESSKLFTISSINTIAEVALFDFSNNRISLKTNANSYFENIYDYKYDLEHSIDVLKRKNNLFINLDQDILSFYSQRHIAWQVFYSRNKKAVPIPKDILKMEKSIFSDKVENMCFV